MRSIDRGLRPALFFMAGVSLAAVLAACAGPASPADPADPARPTASPSASTAGEAQLTVVYRDGSKDSTWQLTCSPAGGSHPDPQTACKVLDGDDGAAFKAVDPQKMCTQVYSGPQTATVTGTWRGRQVDSRHNLTNGCEIARWRALVGLLPPIGS